ncbi:GNAT family N-acetyltransferase [Sabulibacter ruber]|uniref:GNAT family N-acetyltransferase n=1 Tax=Sabulibacter ruber TaxID=2811901 RepID=UPI001A971EE0|nr:GNAT family N-acetyltransferase [Sabulibacter ruber]
MLTFNIRESNENDFEPIFDIWVKNQGQALGKPLPLENIGEFKQELFRVFSNVSQSVFYVAHLESGQIIGWQALTPVFSNPLLSKLIAQSSTYVDKEFFKENVGQNLFNYAVNDARRIGISQIYGWVKPGNNAAERIAENFKHHKLFIPNPANGNVPAFNLYVIEVE